MCVTRKEWDELSDDDKWTEYESESNWAGAYFKLSQKRQKRIEILDNKLSINISCIHALNKEIEELKGEILLRNNIIMRG